ncbi:MAG: hypothetical protein WAL59_13290 [Roseiarcus sp.]
MHGIDGFGGARGQQKRADADAAIEQLTPRKRLRARRNGGSDIFRILPHLSSAPNNRSVSNTLQL